MHELSKPRKGQPIMEMLKEIGQEHKGDLIMNDLIEDIVFSGQLEGCIPVKFRSDIESMLGAFANARERLLENEYDLERRANALVDQLSDTLIKLINNKRHLCSNCLNTSCPNSPDIALANLIVMSGDDRPN